MESCGQTPASMPSVKPETSGCVVWFRWGVGGDFKLHDRVNVSQFPRKPMRGNKVQ